jgi:hypothetical protein
MFENLVLYDVELIVIPCGTICTDLDVQLSIILNQFNIRLSQDYVLYRQNGTYILTTYYYAMVLTKKQSKLIHKLLSSIQHKVLVREELVYESDYVYNKLFTLITDAYPYENSEGRYAIVGEDNKCGFCGCLEFSDNLKNIENKLNKMEKYNFFTNLKITKIY